MQRPRTFLSAISCVLLVASVASGQETVRKFSTFLGGSGQEAGVAIACDPEGNTFIAGRTDSWDFPAPEGLEAPSIVGGVDVFIAKLSPDLKSILAVRTLGGWGDDVAVGTLGGWGDDVAVGIHVTLAGKVIVAGWATEGFPTTPDAYQPENAGGSDIFVSTLSPDLDLIYSTFVGGPGTEEIYRARLDSDGIVTVIGFTSSSSGFPLENAFQADWGGGPTDAVVVQIRPDGALPPDQQLVYSTLLGGNGDDFIDTYSQDAEPSEDGRIAALIFTSSTDLPTTSGQGFRGASDAYLAVLDPARRGSDQLLYSAYLGGSGDDSPNCMRWLDDHTLALAGWTYSSDFPRTDGSSRHGENDIFLSVIDLENSALLYGTLIGGSRYDRPKEMVVTPDGSILISGSTSSGNFPAVHPMDPFVEGMDQPFLFGFRWRRDDPSASKLWFSSSMGGTSGTTGRDSAKGIALQPSGMYAVTGLTGAMDLPTTPGVAQTSFGGGPIDAFVAVVDLRFPLANFTATPTAGPAPLTVSFDATASTTPAGSSPSAFRWDFGTGQTGAGMTSSHVYDEANLGRHVVTLTVENDLGLTSTAKAAVTAYLETMEAEPWRARDVGDPPPRFPGGSRPYAAGTADDFLLCAGGKDIVGSSPEFHFLHREVTGDFAIEAHLEALNAQAPANSRLGLTFRESLDPGARHFTLALVKSTALVQLRSYWRGDTNKSFLHNPDVAALGGWLRVERRGNRFSSWTSADGQAWEPLAIDPPVEIDGLQEPLLAGVCVAERDAATSEVSAFEPILARASRLRAEELTLAEPIFRRGDANADGAVDISDAVSILGYLFLGGETPTCLDAADADDSGQLDISDAIYSLAFEFLGGPAPTAPFQGCGTDPTDDALGCEGFAACD